ncbi:chlamydia polymorphic membrane middle domain protein, partial [Chlamydia psittaci 02DC23]
GGGGGGVLLLLNSKQKTQVKLLPSRLSI